MMDQFNKIPSLVQIFAGVATTMIYIVQRKVEDRNLSKSNA